MELTKSGPNGHIGLLALDIGGGQPYYSRVPVLQYSQNVRIPLIVDFTVHIQ